MYRASRDTMLAVCAAWLIDDCEKSIQDESVYWAEADAGCATEAPIFVDYEHRRISPRHDDGAVWSHLKVAPLPHGFQWTELFRVDITNYLYFFISFNSHLKFCNLHTIMVT